MTPNLTVCIPAYRSEAFIHNTLKSVLAQTYGHFVVNIAVEPPAEETLGACGDLLQDPRIRTTINPEVLGWAENIRRLLLRVETPYFLIHYHDDLMVNDYIATLLAALHERPKASVAYSDMDCFGDASFRWTLRLTEEPIFDRLMSFFLGGTEALPVRGLTRSSVLDCWQFPTDQYDGFAAECEWSLQLLLSGPAVHVARPLYLKRIFAQNEETASRKRLAGRSKDQLFEGLEHHRARLLGLLRKADLPDSMIGALKLAAEAAILRRHMTFMMGAFRPVQLERSKQITAGTATMPGSYGGQIQAMNLLALSRHALIEGDAKGGHELALAAVEVDPLQWEALAHLSRLLLSRDRGSEAFDAALRAWTVAPDANGLRQLISACESSVEQRKFHDMMQGGQAALVAEQFDAAGYLIDHPDVAAVGMNPWQHYCEFGFREGRKVRILTKE
jgi:hypothetical protein